MRRFVRMTTLAALALALPACRGCNPDDLNQVPPSIIQQDEFCQRKEAKVDVLWVVDNSGSMTAEQERVADRFSAFFRQLKTSLVDFHIGVVTTSVQEGKTEDYNGNLRRYSGPAVTNCSGCRFLTRDVPCDHPDQMERREGESTPDYENRLRTDCPAALVFRNLISAGNGGSSFETGLGASTLALGALIDPETGGYRANAAPALNQGFLRRREGTCQPVAHNTGLDCSQVEGDNCAEPSLYLVFVSDEQDHSDGLPRYYWRVLSGLKGAGNEAKIVASVITGWPGQPAVPMERACEVLNNGWDTDPGNDPDLQALQTMFDSQDSACTDATAPPNDPNATARLGSRYVELACRTNGVVANICSGDYSTALDKLGADAAGLARKYVLSKWGEIDFGADNQPLTSDDPDINCDGNPETHPNTDKGICVKATPLNGDSEVLVPRDQALGWHLEAPTHSVRFDGSFIPKPGTKVTITYQLVQTQ